MARNIKSLKSKMDAHQVARTAAHSWTVKSNTSGKFYAVSEKDGVYQCGCLTQRYPRKGESCGCSHVAAVVKFEAESNERSVTLHDGAEAAKRQHRPVIEVGGGLFATTRLDPTVAY